MKSMNQVIVLGLMLSAFTACSKNPYDGLNGTVSTKEFGQKDVYKEWVIAAEDQYNCVETQLCQIEVRAQVPQPGTPVLIIKGYPPGTTAKDFVYDKEKKAYVLSWTPGFEVVDPLKEGGSIKNVPVEFWLSSTDQSGTIVRHTSIITVKNTSREWTVKANGDQEQKEGDLLIQEVSIDSIDYPNGPFQLFVQNAPSGITVQQNATDPKKFTVTFRPDISFVKSTDQRDSAGYYRRLSISYVGKDPGEGTTRTGTSQWKIRDVRQVPMVSGPTAIAARDVATFSLRADDLNGEIPPRFALKGTVPFGKIEIIPTKVTRSTSADYPATFLAVKWTEIPADSQGKTTKLTFEACGDDSVGRSICTSHGIDVQFLAQVPPPPVVDRAAWPMGKVQYVKAGTTTTIALPVQDAEDKARTVKVEIFPEPDRSEVQWVAGALLLTPKTERMIQFKIVATSIAGQIQSESFILDVLPTTWSDVVVLSSDIEKPETQAILTLLPNAAVVHPLFQRDDRTFALRKMFIVTTELVASMSSKSDWSWINKKMQAIANLWVATSLVDKLVQYSTYFAGLLTEREVKIAGRISKVFPNDKLGDFWLELGRTPTLPAATKVVKLSGTLTTQSADPSLVEVAPSSKQCSNLFSLRAQRSIAELAAYCEYQSGGKLIVFGTEFMDLKFDAADSAVLDSWVKQLMKAGGVQ